MAESLSNEIKEFLKSAGLSNYEIRVYTMLLSSDNLTARDISRKSRVPAGRVYDVLEELRERGMIEIRESRPKIYRAISPNAAFHKLITRLNQESQKRMASLFGQAKDLEARIQDSEDFPKKDLSRVFWSTAYGAASAISLYIKKINELEEEVLMTGFLNEGTILVLRHPYARNFYEAIVNAQQRGVQIKYLWSCECDERPLSKEEINRNEELYAKLLKNLEKQFKLSSKLTGVEMRFIHKRIPTFYDIFDRKRVLFKLQNPTQPSQIFACMNVLDPDLATELRKKFDELWVFTAI